MATLLGKYHLADDAPINLSLAAATASAAQSVGARRILHIVSDQAIRILVGNSSVAAPTSSTGILIPANFPFEFQTADQQTFIRVLNLAGAAVANVCIAFLSTV